MIHLGQDVPNRRVKNGDELGQLFIGRFAEFDVQARYFIAPNPDGRATAVTYHIGHLLYEAKGNAVIGLKTAWNDASKVIENLNLVKGLSGARAN